MREGKRRIKGVYLRGCGATPTSVDLCLSPRTKVVVLPSPLLLCWQNIPTQSITFPHADQKQRT